MRRRFVLRSAVRLPRPQRRVRRVSAGASPEWYDTSLLVVIAIGGVLVGFTDPRFVVGMGLLIVTLGLLRLRARVAQPPSGPRTNRHGR